MVNNFGYVNIREILSRLLRHPLLQELNLEAAIQYALDFIGIMGLPNVYVDKVTKEPIDIIDYRGELPCDVVMINQVRDHKTKLPLIALTNSFNGLPGDKDIKFSNHAFKTQGRVIFTSMKDAKLDVSYKGLMLDEEGLPLLPDNSIFLKTLELYIKKEWFTILFDQSKISPAVLQNTQQEYAFKAGQCHNEFKMPSVSEMETITNIINQLVPRTNEFNHGFKSLGTKEYVRLQ